jgi:ADP-ribosylglycohydrolase
MKQGGLYAVLGALTADAASLGLHWLYDTRRLNEIIASSGKPEFLEPRRENYEGYFGYFAHAGRQAGDCSHYGESALVMLRALAGSADFSARPYESLFRLHFGPGGEFCGYIDNATRLTLENLAERDKRAVSLAVALAGSLPAEVRNTLIGKVIPYTRQFSGEALRTPVERAVRITYDDDALVKLAWEIARAVDEAATLCGADDDQVSATAKLPALVARYAGHADLPAYVESAVRVTNNNDEALAYALPVAKLMEAAVLGNGIEEAIHVGLDAAAKPVRDLLDAALAKPKEDPVATAQQLGQTCYVSEAVPVVFYLLRHSSSFIEAVRTNIRMGGDSCGRGIILGAVLAAVYGIGGTAGIPLDWLLRTRRNLEAAGTLAHRRSAA